MTSQLILLLGKAAREPIVHTTTAMASVPVAATSMRAVGLSADLDATMLASGLGDASLWLTLGISALFGGLGGVVAELLSLHGTIELPHRVHRLRTAKRSRLADPRYEIDLGIISRLVLGMAAALALLAVYAPTNATALVVDSLIAGSAATSVFRLVQRRMLGKTLSSEQPAQKSAPKPRLSVVRAAQSSAAQ